MDLLAEDGFTTRSGATLTRDQALVLTDRLDRMEGFA